MMYGESDMLFHVPCNGFDVPQMVPVAADFKPFPVLEKHRLSPQF